MVFDGAIVAELRALCAEGPPVDSLDLQRSSDDLSPEQVRHHLLRSLEPPPEDVTEGRRLLEELAQEVGVSFGGLLAALRRRDGEPRRVWRLSVGQRSTQRLRWLLMREGGFIAIGRNELGDLSGVAPTAEGKAELRARFTQLPGTNAQRATRMAWQFHAFVHTMAAGDVVVAADGARSVGIGVITGGYGYVNDRALAHRRPVTWRSFDEVPLPALEPRDTLLDISHHDAAVLAVEGALLRARVLPAPPTPASAPATPSAAALAGPVVAIDTALRRKGQVILAGPPGTGKTYWAERAALELAARSWFGVGLDALGAEARQQLTDTGPGALGAVEMCCFHPSFGYEDFVEGLRPHTHQGQLVFERRDGLFKALCRRALLNPGRSFFLIVDEINRGDVARILGDLLSILEIDRRGHAITLPLSGERLAVPPNVFLLATMNTADRSTAPLDAALRRRFALLELHPDAAPLTGAVVGAIDLGRLLDALNARIVQQNPRTGFDARVGHAFFLRQGRPLASLAALAQALQQDVLPTLLEHFLGDHGALGALLGPAIVDRAQARLHDALFATGQEDALQAALLEAFPEARALPR